MCHNFLSVAHVFYTKALAKSFNKACHTLKVVARFVEIAM